jgi:site-specific recombinase XerD
MRGERGIFERPPGSGIWWVRYADHYGKIHREKVGVKRSLARARYEQRKTEVREKRFFPPRRKREILFADFVQLYLRNYAKLNKRSWQDDRGRSRRLLAYFGRSSLGEITQLDVEQFKAKLAQEVSPASTNRYLSLLKSIFNRAVEWSKIEKSPAAKVKLLREDNRRTRYLTEEEEERLKAVMTPRSWLLVEFAIHTGLRRGEQFGLLWENVDLENRVITIPLSKSGKTRHVPLNSRALEILRCLPSRLREREDNNPHWVFLSSNGITPIIGSNFVKRIFRPALKKAGIEGFRWHDLRHTFGSRLVMRGTDLRSVMELMGHSKIDMTMRYAHLSNRHIAEAVEVLVDPKKQGPGDTLTGTKEAQEGYPAIDRGLMS